MFSFSFFFLRRNLSRYLLNYYVSVYFRHLDFFERLRNVDEKELTRKYNIVSLRIVSRIDTHLYAHSSVHYWALWVCTAEESDLHRLRVTGPGRYEQCDCHVRFATLQTESHSGVSASALSATAFTAVTT